MTKLVLLIAALAMACASSAHAGEKRAPARKASKAKKSSKLNMPKGWQWPPTEKMQVEGRRCMADLDRLKVNWKPAPKQGRIVAPVYVTDMTFAGVKLVHRYEKGPQVMDCALARAWARHAGPALASLGVVEVRHGQVFKFRDVAGKKGVLSRHSLGLAIDVYAFVTRDGTVHDVLGDYSWGDEILMEIEARITDTGAFRTLLTPGNDPARHYDHFHFEARAAGDAVVSRPTRVLQRAESDGDVIIDVPPPLTSGQARETTRATAGKRRSSEMNARARKGTN
jgi:hypothetical protein